MKTWAKWTIGIVVVIIVLGIIGSLFSTPETEYESGSKLKMVEDSEKKSITGSAVREDEEDSSNDRESDEKIKILNHELTYGEYGTLSVTGTAENVVDRQLSYVEIRVKFYDEDGALIETFFDNINDLDAGEKWKFDVMYPGMDTYEVDDYDIGVGTVW